ncbi:MAG: glycosyltransferase [Bacteroidota bacterium]
MDARTKSRPTRPKGYEQIDIIYLGIFRWDGPFSSISIALAKEFARHNRVFYINHPYSVKDFFNLQQPSELARRGDLLRNRVRFESGGDLPERLVSVTPPLTLPINWLRQGRLHQRLWQLNDQQIQKTIRKIIKTYGVKKYLFINCFDPYFGHALPKESPPLLNIYQCVDDISADGYSGRHGARLEQQAIRKADLTLVTSHELLRICKQYSDQVYTLNNAADTQNFQRAVFERFAKPDDIRHSRGKIIGYMGNLDNSRVDYPLLKYVAEQFPDDTLLLVGPINNEEYKEIGLDRMPNVVMTGGKSIDDLPPYLQHFDCALIPFLCNKLTKSIYPLKINEYLAAGKAVISTRFSVDIEQFDDHIYLADDAEHFANLIRTALQEKAVDFQKKRLLLANQNTREARVDSFWQLLQPHLAKRDVVSEFETP